MKFSESLKKNRDFQSVYRKGKPYGNKYLVMYLLANDLGRSRVGISVSKKVGNSIDLTQAPMSLWIPLRKLPLFFVLPEYMPRNFSSSWANWLRLLRLCGEWGVDL